MSEAPVLFFDGHCHLCNESVRWLLRLDRRRLLHYAPLQGETAERLFREKGVNRESLPDSIILYDGLRILTGFYALAGIARLFWPQGRMIWALFGYPPISWIGSGLYRLVAIVRYRIFGRTEYCSVGKKEDRALFLP